MSVVSCQLSLGLSAIQVLHAAQSRRDKRRSWRNTPRAGDSGGVVDNAGPGTVIVGADEECPRTGIEEDSTSGRIGGGESGGEAGICLFVDAARVIKRACPSLVESHGIIISFSMKLSWRRLVGRAVAGRRRPKRNERRAWIIVQATHRRTREEDDLLIDFQLGIQLSAVKRVYLSFGAVSTNKRRIIAASQGEPGSRSALFPLKVTTSSHLSGPSTSLVSRL